MARIPETLDELFAADRDSIDWDLGNPWTLHQKLGFSPWLPAAPHVWLTAECPDWCKRDDWEKVKAMLDELHAEHLRRDQ